MSSSTRHFTFCSTQETNTLKHSLFSKKLSKETTLYASMKSPSKPSRPRYHRQPSRHYELVDGEMKWFRHRVSENVGLGDTPSSLSYIFNNNFKDDATRKLNDIAFAFNFSDGLGPRVKVLDNKFDEDDEVMSSAHSHQVWHISGISNVLKFIEPQPASHVAVALHCCDIYSTGPSQQNTTAIALLDDTLSSSSPKISQYAANGDAGDGDVSMDKKESRRLRRRLDGVGAAVRKLTKSLGKRICNVMKQCKQKLQRLCKRMKRRRKHQIDDNIVLMSHQ